MLQIVIMEHNKTITPMMAFAPKMLASEKKWSSE